MPCMANEAHNETACDGKSAAAFEEYSGKPAAVAEDYGDNAAVPVEEHGEKTAVPIEEHSGKTATTSGNSNGKAVAVTEKRDDEDAPSAIVGGHAAAKGGAQAVFAQRSRSAAGQTPPIVLDAAQRALDERYMGMAIEQARRAASLGEVPIGAVVVHQPIDRGTRRALSEPQVIAQACNLRETTCDPAGHAELIAMREAARALGAWRLSDCTVYVTLEPCIMCAGLMHQARIRRCVFGAPDQKAGALGTLYAINEDTRLNHRFEATPGVRREECVALLRSFFAERRKRK